MPRRSPEVTLELRASLLRHARRILERDGVDALTMRALAAEAGTAVGLPYKVFANRGEIVAELVSSEFTQLRTELDRWVESAGTATVGDNLVGYARIMLDTDLPVWKLVEDLGDPALHHAATATSGATELIRSFDDTVRDYLIAEQRLGRIDPAAPVDAFAFLITGAIHNLLVAGPGYPRPPREQLDQFLRQVADRISAPV
jgi:AcrR family transcriptional regulator